MKRIKIKGPCNIDGCRRKAKIKFDCLTCEALVEAGKTKTAFAVRVCKPHGARGQQRIRRHALVAHPVNILRAGLAALKGEDLS
jgi:hypothetical protein